MGTNYHHELLDTIIDLQERGFDHDFIICGGQIRCLCPDKIMGGGDFDVLGRFHCHDKTQRKGNYMVYAIQLKNDCIKGIILVNGLSRPPGMSRQLWQKFF